MAFDDETTDVLIGGYLSKDAAKDDYEAVLGSGGYLHGAVVVAKDLTGNLSVEQTDHMVREGAAGLGAVGFAVGLFAPPCSPRPRSVRQSAPVPVPEDCCTTGPPTNSKSRPARRYRSAAPASLSPTHTRLPTKSNPP